jgi:hypothetical protein
VHFLRWPESFIDYFPRGIALFNRILLFCFASTPGLPYSVKCKKLATVKIVDATCCHSLNARNSSFLSLIEEMRWYLYWHKKDVLCSFCCFLFVPLNVTHEINNQEWIRTHKKKIDLKHRLDHQRFFLMNVRECEKRKKSFNQVVRF